MVHRLKFALLGLLASALCLLSCTAEEPRRRVLLIGIDGAEPELVSALRQQGRLPHLSRIADEGASGTIRSLMPLLSPRIWTSAATGKTPEKHGIKGFVRDLAGGERRLMNGSDRQVPALWNIASAYGRRVAVIDWWFSFPPEVVDGVVVSDHLIAERVQEQARFYKGATGKSGPAVYPESWWPRASALAKDPRPLGDLEDPFAGLPRLPGIDPKALEKRWIRDMVMTRIALDVEEETDPDLLMVYLNGVDPISHFLWAAVDPKGAELDLGWSQEQREQAAEGLRRYYAFADSLVGLLVERFAPGDLIIVLSDHGFDAHVRRIGTSMLTGWHEHESAVNGILFARGRGIPHASGAQGTSILDLTPTVLAWLGLPVGEDMDGAVASFLELDEAPAIVASHDGVAVERIATHQESGGETEMLENLRELGYIE